MNVKIEWINECVEKLYCFGGQIDLGNFEEYVSSKTLQTTLTKKGILAVERCERKEKFHVLIPGVGWADVWVYGQ